MKCLRKVPIRQASATFALLCAWTGASNAATPAAPPAPCASAEHRHFDFWIGEWRVLKRDGTLAGNSRITLEHGDCVVHEHYTTPKGYSGESFNIYDAARKVWHQSWVDNTGLLLMLDGRWDGKSMILEGVSPDAKGVMTKQRITWTPNSDGSVRQLWETADEKGGWTVAFDGKYTRS